MTESSRASLPEEISESEFTLSPFFFTKSPSSIFTSTAVATMTIAAAE